MSQGPLAQKLVQHEVITAGELTAGRSLVARLIGRRFHDLAGPFEQPFDPKLGKAMLKTLLHLCSELGASFGYCERQEMSLYAVGSGGDARRLIARLGGEAAGKLSLLLGEVATFEAQLFEFPSSDLAFDYFWWRREECVRDTLDAYCLKVLAESGADARAIPTILEGHDVDEKIELLRQKSVDYAELPAWQRRGAYVFMDRCVDAAQGQDASTHGRLVVDLNVPETEGAHLDYLRRLIG